jgi:hypothetical protein
MTFTRFSAAGIGAVLIAAGFATAEAPIAARTRAERVEKTVTLPAGTVIRVRVERGFGSDISRVEDPVSGTLARAVVVNGTTLVPEGSSVHGYVSQAVRPGRVKGRGRVGVRFTRLIDARERETYSIRTRPWVAVAPATKKKDAMTIGVPAAGGAVVGGLVGGKKGAAVGALAGGGGGTAVVLATRGKDVRVGRGAVLAVRLSAPLTVRVRR